MRSITRWAMAILTLVTSVQLCAQAPAPKYEMFYFVTGGYSSALQIINPSSITVDIPGIGRVEGYQTFKLQGWPGVCVNGHLDSDVNAACGGTKVISIPAPLVPMTIMTDDTGSSIESRPLVRFKGTDVQVQALDTNAPNRSLMFVSSDVTLDFLHDGAMVLPAVSPTLCTGVYCFVTVPLNANRVVVHHFSGGGAGLDGSFVIGGIVFDAHGAQIWREPTELPVQ